MDKNSLAHTQWNCKYHIVFAPPPETKRKRFRGLPKREERAYTVRAACKLEV